MAAPVVLGFVTPQSRDQDFSSSGRQLRSSFRAKAIRFAKANSANIR
jgi:hypothetical protein